MNKNSLDLSSLSRLHWLKKFISHILHAKINDPDQLLHTFNMFLVEPLDMITVKSIPGRTRHWTHRLHPNWRHGVFRSNFPLQPWGGWWGFLFWNRWVLKLTIQMDSNASNDPTTSNNYNKYSCSNQNVELMMSKASHVSTKMQTRWLKSFRLYLSMINDIQWLLIVGTVLASRSNWPCAGDSTMSLVKASTLHVKPTGEWKCY